MSLKKISDLKRPLCEYDTICNEAYNKLDRYILTLDSSVSLETAIADMEPIIVELFGCLIETETEPEIAAFKFDSITHLAELLITSKTRESIGPHIADYCAFYYTSIYQYYLNKIRGISGHATLGKVAAKYERERAAARETSENDVLLEGDNYNTMYDIVKFLDFMGSKYSYRANQRTAVDFLLSYSKWSGHTVSAELTNIDGDRDLPPYMKMYTRGCNCFCSSVTIGTYLAIFARRNRLDLDPSRLMFIDDHTSGCHVYLLYKFPYRGNDVPFLIETTGDLLKIPASRNINYHIEYLLYISNTLAVGKSATSEVPISKLPYLVLRERLITNDRSSRDFTDEKFTEWHSKGYLDDESMDWMVITQGTNVNGAELFYRINRFMDQFSESQILWKTVNTTFRSLKSITTGGDMKRYTQQHSKRGREYKGVTITESIHSILKKLSMSSKSGHIVAAESFLKSMI